MIRQPVKETTANALGILSIVGCICFYAVLSIRQHQINPYDTTIPGFFQFIEGFQKLLSENWLIKDTIATGSRSLIGMSVGVTISFIIGISMGVNSYVEAFFKWPVTVFSYLPPTAMLAVYLALFGHDLLMFTAMIALGIFCQVTKSIYQAARTDVTAHAIYKAYTLGASDFEVIYEVVIWQILPRIIDSIRHSIGPAMIFLIAAEWSFAGEGFGYRLKYESRPSHMNVVYIYLMVLGLFGFVSDWLLLDFRRYLSPWFEQKQSVLAPIWSIIFRKETNVTHSK